MSASDDFINDMRRMLRHSLSDEASVLALSDWLAPDGAPDRHRFVAVMLLASQVVAFMPGAEAQMAKSVARLRLDAVKLVPDPAPTGAPN